MSASSKKLVKITPAMYVMQAVAYAAFAVVLGLFSQYPKYTFVDPNASLIKLSLSHPGKHVVECRKRSRAEMESIKSTTKRKTSTCSRDRHGVRIALSLDGEPLFDEVAPPRGLKNDGPASFYEKFVVPSGKHRLLVQMNETGGEGPFHYTLDKEVELAPGENLVIDFLPEDNELYLR